MSHLSPGLVTMAIVLVVAEVVSQGGMYSLRLEVLMRTKKKTLLQLVPPFCHVK